jgi:methionyl-tRNA formyltransferase
MEDKRAGVTLHWSNEEINGGDIIASQTISIGREDTSFSIYLKLSKIAMELFKSNFPKVIKRAAPRTAQQPDQATYHAAGYPEQRNIDWNKSAESIDRFIRALTFPGFDSARTFYNDMEISILHPVKIITRTEINKNANPGTILNISSEGILLKTGDHALLIEKVKINQSMPIDSYKLGRLFNLRLGESFRSVEKLHTESQLNLIVP